MQEHLTISSKAFGATSSSVIIGIRLDSQNFKSQSVGSRSNPLNA